MDKNISQKKLEKLLELNRQISLEHNFTKRIKIISDTLKEILKVDRCSIFLHDKDTKTMWSVYIDGVSYIEIPDNLGIASEVFNTKKHIIVNEPKKDSRFNPSIDKGSNYVTKAILAVPIMGFGGRILGVMQFINKLDGVGKFKEEDIEIVNYVINHISAYLEQMTQS